MTPIIHVWCEQVAFLYDRPDRGDAIESDRAQLLDGRVPELGSEMTCGSCGGPIYDPATDLAW